MRIISGELKGRNFNDASSGNTHPMSEKIRGALFNTLGDIKGLSVLDAFSGTGALAFEAVSRGAKEVLAIELDKQAYSDVVKSVKILGIENKLVAVRGNIASKVRNLSSSYDLVFCDPPFTDINRTILRRIAGATKPGGIVIYSLPDDIDLGLEKAEFKHLSTKNYGDATLQFYRRTS